MQPPALYGKKEHGETLVKIKIRHISECWLST